MNRIITLGRVLKLFAKTITAYISRLFLLDLWTDRAAWPLLFYALFIHIVGMLLFNWLEGWGNLNALYFTFTTLATIGYGDFVPSSGVSKILTIFFSINGIVLLLVLFDLIRDIRIREFREQSAKLKHKSSGLISRDTRESSLAADEVYSEEIPSPKSTSNSGGEQLSQSASWSSPIRPWLFPLDLWTDKDARLVLIYATFITAVGAFLFHTIEGWGWLNSTYFVIVTLTTIGFGDFVPVTDVGKIITIFYGLNGIVIFLGVFDSIRRVLTQH